ncbi:MAG: hypothetical protein ABIP90_11255 [Vicinamibacterales bacterium]
MRIRSGVPLRTSAQTLYHCAYLAGAVDAQRGAVQQLISIPRNPLSASSNAEERGLRESYYAPQPPAPMTAREVYQAVHPRNWMREIGEGFRMDLPTAKTAIALFVAAVAWYAWWLLVRL